MPRSPNRAKMFETRSHAWREVGLQLQIDRQAVKRARTQVLIFVPLFVAIVVVQDHRKEWLGSDQPVTVAAVIALLMLGWAIARDFGKVFGPAFFRRMDPATAGTVGFLVRLATVVATLLVALRIAGVKPTTLAVGGGFTAVVVGLAAQQTLGNFIAGTVLLSARPFRVGERVRLQAGAVGGQVEGVVSSLGLLYTTLAVSTSSSTTGEDSIMVPNSVVLSAVIIPLREPDAVVLRARLRPGVTPGDLQALLEESLRTPIRYPPSISLEELDGEEVIVRIVATPRLAADGRDLATELLEIVSQLTPGVDGARTPHDAPAAPDHGGQDAPDTTERSDRQ